MVEIKVIVSVNEKGYKSIDLKIGNQTVYLTRSLTRFEINYLVNRSNNLIVDVRTEKYKDIEYENLVICEKDGFDNEYIVVKGLDSVFKGYLINQIFSEKVDL